MRENVVEGHELHELEELRGGVLEPHLPSISVCSELEPRERIDRDGIGLHATHIAKHVGGGVFLEDAADPVTEPWQILPRNRSIDSEFGGACHR